MALGHDATRPNGWPAGVLPVMLAGEPWDPKDEGLIIDEGAVANLPGLKICLTYTILSSTPTQKPTRCDRSCVDFKIKACQDKISVGPSQLHPCIDQMLLAVLCISRQTDAGLASGHHCCHLRCRVLLLD
jgi:hypothetical protein